MFAYFNPIQLSVDPITMLWLNAFALNLQRSVKMLSVEQTDPPYLDVKIEAIMFRVSRFFIILYKLCMCYNFIPISDYIRDGSINRKFGFSDLGRSIEEWVELEQLNGNLCQLIFPFSPKIWAIFGVFSK